jgi:uncharacterized protein YjiK
MQYLHFRRIYLGLLAALIATGNVASAHGESGPPAKQAQHFELPKKLREASGLALSQEGHLFTHNDEKGIIYRFDPKTGKVKKVLKIGSPALRDDFEAIAIINHDFYLTTSKGALHWITDGLNYDNEIATSVILKTGLAEVCEVEGLSSFAEQLYFGCKTNYQQSDHQYIIVFRFNPKTSTLIKYLTMSLADLRLEKFQTSGIEVTESKIYLTSAGERRILIVDHKGKLLSQHRPAKRQHRKMEGIAVSASGRIYLAGEGKKRGQLSIYNSIEDI